MTRTQSIILATIFTLSFCSCSEQAIVIEEAPQPQAVTSGSDVDTSTYRQIIRDESRLVIVDFHADWCAPCKMLAPSLEKIAAAHSDDVLLIKVNVDNNPELAAELQIMSIPYVQFYKGGKAVDQFIGLVSEERIEALVQKHKTRS